MSVSTQRSAQIVFRLRAAFTAITVLLIVGIFFISVQLSRLSNAHSQITQLSVPSLIRSQELERLLSKTLILQDQIRTASTTHEIAKIEKSIDSLNTDVNELLNTTLVRSQNALLTDIGTELEEIVTSNALLFSYLTVIESSELSLLGGRDSLLRVRESFRALVEPLVIDAESILRTTLIAIDRETVNASEITDTIFSQVYNQSKLNEISFRFLATTELAEQLSLQNIDIERQVDTATIQYNIRIVVQLLTAIDKSEIQRNLARLTNELHNIIFAADGVLAQLATVADYKQQFDSYQAIQTQRISNVSEAINYVVDNATDEIFDSTAAFKNALSDAVLSVIIAATVISLIIALLSYFVVERQLNRRLSRLTDAVLRIAKGDMDHSVGVSGVDELGLMANSLEVFRDTAIKLRLSNQEMEQFAYAASHDLRSPLRAIENLALWTIEDLAPELPEEALENLNKILERAKRLSSLQTDLLEYSRAGHLESPVESVSIKLLVEDLSELLDERQLFSVICDDEINYVNTYKTPLQQILTNLINNAIKHHDKAKGVITVSVIQLDKRIEIQVHDNGPGIEQEYQERIFGLFNRLKPPDEVEGSGLGLALIRKLVKRYNGTITVVSNPSIAPGSTFIFDWPVFPADNLVLNAG